MKLLLKMVPDIDVSEQQEAWRDPVTLQGQCEPSSQPMAVFEFSKTTSSGRVVKRSH